MIRVGIDPLDGGLVGWRETYGKGVTKVIYRDADGNEISFGGAPR